MRSREITLLHKQIDEYKNYIDNAEENGCDDLITEKEILNSLQIRLAELEPVIYSVAQPMDELSTWLKIKSFIDTNDIVGTAEFENLLIAKGNIDLQRNISRTPYYYNRALNYINARRSERIKEIYFESEEKIHE